MFPAALGDDDDDMHPQLAYDIARLRHAELTSHVDRHDSSTRVRFWRRRRRAVSIASIAPLTRRASLRLAAQRSA
jgi:hypothetical protein